jgi:hypothetical protein
MGLAHASAARRYRGIKVFFSSLAGIEGMPADLLDGTAHPKVPETPIAVVEEGATRRLMHSLNAKSIRGPPGPGDRGTPGSHGRSPRRTGRVAG